MAFDDIAGAFRRYSLVEVSAERNSFTVHRLVQAVMRSRMTDDESAKWAQAAERLVNNAFPGGEVSQQPDTWPLCGELLLHALSVTERTEAFKVANEQTAYLLAQLGAYLLVLARYTEAKGQPLNVLYECDRRLAFLARRRGRFRAGPGDDYMNYLDHLLQRSAVFKIVRHQFLLPIFASGSFPFLSPNDALDTRGIRFGPR